jgi:hypothetical protein
MGPKDTTSFNQRISLPFIRILDMLRPGQPGFDGNTHRSGRRELIQTPTSECLCAPDRQSPHIATREDDCHWPPWSAIFYVESPDFELSSLLNRRSDS